MASPGGPPVLSTLATHIFEDQPQRLGAQSNSYLSDEQLYTIYEIEKTISKIREERYARVALQLPDEMLPDAPRLSEALSKGLKLSPSRSNETMVVPEIVDKLDLSPETVNAVKLYILADTSYGACCVDEIAAEHINADAVVHYGRACLSPTARIPVIHIFTNQPLPGKTRLVKEFEGFYQDHEQKIILMADVTYQEHLQDIMTELLFRKFRNVFVANIIYDPSSLLPNRTVPEEVKTDSSKLREWQLFHLSNPPASLLLILASRVGSIRIYPTSGYGLEDYQEPFVTSASRALNRRYALLTSGNAVSIFGILINTLSVRNYLHIVEHVKSQIQAAGKKSYTFVVGKVNAAKVANFSEIGAWVVIGCWESSLVDSKDFWKPVLTPFELELALQRDEQRIWTGEWSSDFQKILEESETNTAQAQSPSENGLISENEGSGGDYESDSESAPPDFDLRTGRYVSNSRPIPPSPSLAGMSSATKDSLAKSLVKRATGDLAIVGGELSPGAEHLRSKRTWKGLGSDFEIAYEETSTVVEEGRSGIAGGYAHGTAPETRR